MPEHDHIAEWTFSMGLELSTESNAIPVKINKVKGSYTAHEMKQRLPAPELTGKVFKLNNVSSGRRLQQADPDNGPTMELGGMFKQGYSIGLALADIMPVLPEEPIALGSHWITEHTTRSIEGWAWASGLVQSNHTVTAIDHHGGHSVVSVTTTASGRLGAVEGGRLYSGDGTLERTSNWRFDATNGQLLSVSMQQSTNGINTLPQGEVSVQQLTKVEFTLLP